MASLAEREGLRGQVQCIYFDPPYGIKFNSNWQVSTRSRDVKDGKTRRNLARAGAGEGLPRHLEGRHPLYLTYLRDRLTVARDLLTESGSIFVQIGDENVHRVRAFWMRYSAKKISSRKSLFKRHGDSQQLPGDCHDFLLWYAQQREQLSFEPLCSKRHQGGRRHGYTSGFEVEDLDVRSSMTHEEKRDQPSTAEDSSLRMTTTNQARAQRRATTFRFVGRLSTGRIRIGKRREE